MANRFDKLQRDWGGLWEEFKYHLVDWYTVCTWIHEGGLREKASYLQSKLIREMVVDRWGKVVCEAWGMLG